MSREEALSALLRKINEFRESDRFKAMPRTKQRELLAYACGVLDAIKVTGEVLS